MSKPDAVKFEALKERVKWLRPNWTPAKDYTPELASHTLVLELLDGIDYLASLTAPSVAGEVERLTRERDICGGQNAKMADKCRDYKAEVERLRNIVDKTVAWWNASFAVSAVKERVQCVQALAEYRASAPPSAEVCPLCKGSGNVVRPGMHWKAIRGDEDAIGACPNGCKAPSAEVEIVCADGPLPPSDLAELKKYKEFRRIRALAEGIESAKNPAPEGREDEICSTPPQPDAAKLVEALKGMVSSMEVIANDYLATHKGGSLDVARERLVDAKAALSAAGAL